MLHIYPCNLLCGRILSKLYRHLRVATSNRSHLGTGELGHNTKIHIFPVVPKCANAHIKGRLQLITGGHEELRRHGITSPAEGESSSRWTPVFWKFSEVQRDQVSPHMIMALFFRLPSDKYNACLPWYHRFDNTNKISFRNPPDIR